MRVVLLMGVMVLVLVTEKMNVRPRGMIVRLRDRHSRVRMRSTNALAAQHKQNQYKGNKTSHHSGSAQESRIEQLRIGGWPHLVKQNAVRVMISFTW
jgi:hypothetical protein